MIAWISFVGVACGYYVLAGVGFRWAIEPGNVCAVWLPTGIALGAFQLRPRSPSVAAGIWCGSFMANTFGWPSVDYSAPKVCAAVVIATASTMETWLASGMAIRRVLNSPKSTFQWFGWILGCCLIAGCTGPAILAISGFLTWPHVPSAIVTWWLGDASGMLLLAPVMFAWRQRPTAAWIRSRWRELTGAFVVLVLLLWLVFSPPTGWQRAPVQPLILVLLPLLCWLSVRFSYRETATATLVIALWGIMATASDHGPFAPGNLNDRLLLLQGFVIVIGLSGAVTSAAIQQYSDALAALEKQIEERCRSERHLQSILDSVLDAIVTFDASGLVTGWNPQAHRIFGWHAAEAIGKEVWELIIPDDDRNCQREAFRRALASESASPLGKRLEMQVIRRSGEVFPAEWSLAAHATPLGTSFIAFLRDVTEQKRYEERFRATVEASPTANILVDENGSIVLMNSQAERLFGYSRHELLGRYVELLVPERFRSQHCDNRRRYFERPEPRPMGLGRELYGLRKDGSEFPIEIGLNVVRTLDGPCVLSSIVDISLRREAEITLRAYKDRLEEQVSRRTAFVRLLQDTAVIANEAESVETALEATLGKVRSFLMWPLGHAWIIPCDGTMHLIDSGIWSVDAPDQFRTVMLATREILADDQETIVGSVARNGLPLWTENLVNDPSFLRGRAAGHAIKTAVFVPVLVVSRVVAVLEFFHDVAMAPETELIQVLARVGIQLGRVVERKELEKELADLSLREQRRFGMELHDDFGQQLTAIACIATGVLCRLRNDRSPYVETMQQLIALITDAQTDLRRMIKGLHPVEVDANGLMGALERLASDVQNRSDTQCDFSCERPVPVRDDMTATHLFYIAREAVHNAQKHAGAKRLSIRLTRRGGEIILTIRDDGAGLAGKYRESEGMGLKIMRYRAGLIGASLSVATSPTEGTVVTCVLKKEPRLLSTTPFASQRGNTQLVRIRGE